MWTAHHIHHSTHTTTAEATNSSSSVAQSPQAPNVNMQWNRRLSPFSEGTVWRHDTVLMTRRENPWAPISRTQRHIRSSQQTLRCVLSGPLTDPAVSYDSLSCLIVLTNLNAPWEEALSHIHLDAPASPAVLSKPGWACQLPGWLSTYTDSLARSLGTGHRKHCL